jgi:dolichol-phosphate mannosyltransferase
MITKTVSVIIPTYNEKENLPILIEKLNNVFTDGKITGEVIIIDDSSPDGTGQLAEQLKEKYKFLKVIHRPSKMGLGSAYGEGFRAAESKLLLTMDADLSHDPDYIPRFIERAEQADVVVGSRYVEGGGIIGWGLYRRMVSKLAKSLARIAVGAGVSDMTSGYRAYRKEVFGKVDTEEIKSSGYAFQLEIINEIREKGFKIDEVPIIFTDRRRGRSKLGLRDIISFLMLAIRLGLSNDSCEPVFPSSSTAGFLSIFK